MILFLDHKLVPNMEYGKGPLWEGFLCIKCGVKIYRPTTNNYNYKGPSVFYRGAIAYGEFNLTCEETIIKDIIT